MYSNTHSIYLIDIRFCSKDIKISTRHVVDNPISAMDEKLTLQQKYYKLY